MTEVKQVKEELLAECGKFAALLKEKPKLDVSLLSMNREVFCKLQEVLLKGDEEDKKEAMTAFAQVFGALGDLSKQVSANLGLSPDLLQGGNGMSHETSEMIKKLGKDLEGIASKAL